MVFSLFSGRRQSGIWSDFATYTCCLIFKHRVASHASQRFSGFSLHCSTKLSTEVVNELIFNPLHRLKRHCLFNRHRLAGRAK